MKVKNIGRLALAALVTGGALVAAPSSASAMPDALGLQVWSDANGKGLYRNIFGPQNPDMSRIGMSNNISSIKANGTTWCLFKQVGYSGAMTKIGAGEYWGNLDVNPVGWNDVIASAKRC